MTLDELALLLPNGFHDAQLTTVKVDYPRHQLRLGMKIWVGDLGSPRDELREARRAAVVTLSGLLFCVIEPPDPRYPHRDAEALTIDVGPVASPPFLAAAPPPCETPEGSFTSWIFVQEWNSFIYVSATGASLTWEDESGAAEAEA